MTTTTINQITHRRTSQMRFESKIRTQAGSNPEHDQRVAQRQQLPHLLAELTDMRADITDKDGGEALRAKVTNWILRAQKAPSSNSADQISNVLASIRKEHAMYRKPRETDASAAFPDECKDCEHYGIACPVLTDNDQIKRRQQILDSTSTSNERRHKLQEYAIDNSCVVLQRELSETKSQLEPLINEGRQLLMAVEERVLYRNDSETVSRALANADVGLEEAINGQ